MQRSQRLPLWRHRRSVFWIFLTTYVLISAISLPLTTYSHVRVNRVLQNKIGEETNAQLKQAAQTVSGMFAGLRQAVTAVGFNTQNSSLLYASLPLGPDAVYRLTQYISRVQDAYVACGDLYDLYTYFAGMDSVVTRTTRYEAGAYYRLFLQYEGGGYEGWHAEINQYAYMRYHPARRIGAVGNGREVITLSLSQSGASGRQVHATVVAAIEVQTVAQAFVQTNFLRQGQVQLRVGEQALCTLGQPLYDPAALAALPFAAGGAVWTAIDGRQVLLLSASGSADGMELLCVIPAEAYLRELDTTRRLVFTILGVELALCLLLSVAFAWLNFSPIRKATEKLPEAVRGSRPAGNEIELITSASLALFDENQRITQVLADQRQLMRSSLLRQLLLGGIATERMAWDSVDLRFSNPCFAVVLLHLEDGGALPAEDSVERQILLEYTLLHLLVGHCEALYPSHGTEMESERVAVLVNLPEGIQADALWRVCSEYSDLCFTELGVLVSVGIGDVQAGIVRIADAYRSALAALEHVRLWEAGNIALYERIGQGMPAYAYTQEMENAVLHGVRLGRMDTVEKVVDDVLRQCDRQPMPYVRGVLYDVVGTGMKLMAEMGVEPAQVFDRADAPMQWIKAAQTAQEMRDALLSVLGAIAGHLSADRSQRNEQLYGQVNRMIGERFSDSNFSLSVVAEHFGLNASYLSHLYKKQSGENFIDRLNSVRISHAKALLRETGQPVAQIATACGYISAAYFSRAFKRLEGCTPGQYRGGQ